MGNNLLDILLPPESISPDRIFGVVVGIVTNNNDPEGIGRVKVRFPWLSGTDESADESAWARIAASMAGKGRGAYFLPEVDDEVLVAFDHGDIRFPYVLGALWNGQDQPPAANNDGKNNLRLIQSRSGHIIRLDDTSGAEKIEILDKSGKQSGHRHKQERDHDQGRGRHHTRVDAGKGDDQGTGNRGSGNGPGREGERRRQDGPVGRTGAEHQGSDREHQLNWE